MKIIFNTRDKKPKLYHVAVISVITAVLLAVLQVTGGEANLLPAAIVLDIFFLVVVLLLLDAFIKQLKYNPYSYNTIYYMGFALYLASTLASHIILTVNLISNPEMYAGNGMANILYTLLSMPWMYIFFSFPFILAFSVGLFISNIVLLRHEGKRFSNVLGMILALLLVAGALCLYRFNYYVSGSIQEVMMHDIIASILSSVYLYVEGMVIGTIVADVITARYEPQPDKDFVIILGCKPRRDGTPTPLLRGRIDRAVAFYRKQKELTGKELTFIPSGGKGADEPMAESACMKNYLLAQGIPECRIIEEDQSANTFENMKFSKAKIEAIDPQAKVAFSTTNYHVFRSGIYARRQKMRAVGMGAETKWYFWPNAAVREFVGLLKAHKLKQGVILGAMIAAYAVLTIVEYQI